MFAKIINGVVEKYPYSIYDLRRENPNTSFSQNPDSETLAQFNVYRVHKETQPTVDPITQNVIEKPLALIDGKWTHGFEVVSATEEEIEQRKADRNKEIRYQRLEEYKRFSDPLFFKWQRDEATKEEWVWAVQQIKEHYPYVE
jgi:hypothetical protein